MPTVAISIGFGQHCEETRHLDRYRWENCGTWTVAYPTGERPKYAADTTLVHEGEITVQKLIQLLAERVNEVDESSLQ